MRVLITGASGAVGRFILPALLAAGHDVTTLGRTAMPGAAHLDWRLGEMPEPPEADALVHAAFDHVPGRYRGGEGDDPEGFRRRNVEGTRLLFEAALARGARRIVFLSSRAAYGDAAPGTTLREADPVAPGTLYGDVKRAAERMLDDLAERGARPVSLRATGVYGLAPGATEHKWSGLFRSYLAGEGIAPRAGTEVHGDDLAAAVTLLLASGAPDRLLNVSDMVVDRHVLLGRVAALTGCRHPRPARAAAGALAVMATDRLRALGWKPGGWDRLEAELPAMIAAAG